MTANEIYQQYKIECTKMRALIAFQDSILRGFLHNKDKCKTEYSKVIKKLGELSNDTVGVRCHLEDLAFQAVQKEWEDVNAK